MNQKRFQFRARFSAMLFVFMMLPNAGTSFSLWLPVQNAEAELFLGEHVRLSNSEGSIERQMMGLSDDEYLRVLERYEITTRWETEAGTSIGEWKALQRLTPTADKTYRLCVSVSPKRGEVHGLAQSAPLTEYEALYRVRVKPGTITVRVSTEGTSRFEDKELLFRARKESGEIFTCTVTPESDPETGVTFLSGEFTGLPYGVYTVFPVGEAEEICAEDSCRCSLGVWDRDDTVSVHRAAAEAKFTFS